MTFELTEDEARLVIDTLYASRRTLALVVGRTIEQQAFKQSRQLPGAPIAKRPTR